MSSRASGSRRVTNTTSASWSISVARSTNLPSSFIARAARARPGPIASATVAPVTGASKWRTDLSGRLMAGIGGYSSFHSERLSMATRLLLRKSYDFAVNVQRRRLHRADGIVGLHCRPGSLRQRGTLLRVECQDPLYGGRERRRISRGHAP